MLGSGAMTNSIEDVTRKAEVIMLVGSNPEEAHPVIGMQIRAAVERGCRLIVVDPRDIGLAAHADIHLKLRPGTNVAFANGIVNYLIQHELYDEEFVRERTEGFEILAATVRDYTPELVEEYRAMIKEGCEQEIRWGHYAIGDEVAGLNKQMVTDYIQYLGNLRCTQLGFEPCIEGHEREPESMSWVSQFSNANMIKTDFFEARSTAYAKSSALVDDL